MVQGDITAKHCHYVVTALNDFQVIKNERVLTHCVSVLLRVLFILEFETV